MIDKLLGLEVETHIIDENGNIVDKADDIINNKYASHHLQKELAHSMLEITADPSSDLKKLATNIGKETQNAVDVAQSQGLLLVPSTTIGKCNLRKREGERYRKKELILGKEKRNMEYHICGTHVHVDRDRDLVAQHTLMTSLDPLFVLMSSSPFFMGNNHLKDYRVKMYRDVIFKDFPLNGALLGYIGNDEELQRRVDDTYNIWMQECEKYGVNKEGFTRLNSCWGPLRLSENTIESRTADTNMLSNVLALAAVYAGMNRQLGNTEFEIPSYKQLKHFERVGIKQGLEDEGLYQYLTQVIQTAERGLQNHELQYLEPFEQMLRDRRTVSDEMMTYSRQKGFYDGNSITQDGARNLRLHIANTFKEDVDKVNKYN